MPETHDFGAGSFASELWIAKKKVFHNLKGVDVEFLVSGGWDWLIADSTGVVIKTVRGKEMGGWTSIDLPTLGIYGDHSIGFRSIPPGVKKIRAGVVTFG